MFVGRFFPNGGTIYTLFFMPVATVTNSTQIATLRIRCAYSMHFVNIITLFHYKATIQGALYSELYRVCPVSEETYTIK